MNEPGVYLLDANVFIEADAGEVLGEFRRVMAWVTGQRQFADAAKREFADGADGWLVAYAKRRVPIPNVCNAFGVRYLDTFEMLRELGMRLA